MAVNEYLAAVVDLSLAVDVVMVDTDMSEEGEVLTPLIALHLRIEISKLKITNILKNNAGSCIHTRNLKFIR